LWGQSKWVNFLAPMTLTSSLQVITRDTVDMKQATPLPVVTGLFGPFNGSSPTDVVDEVYAAYQARANGVAVFDTAHLTQKMSEALRSGVFHFDSAKGRP